MVISPHFLGQSIAQTEKKFLKHENDLETKLRSILNAEIQAIKEQQSQSFKNHNVKVTNEYSNLKTTLEKQIQAVNDKQNDRFFKIEQVFDELNQKFNLNMNDINSKSLVDKSSLKGMKRKSIFFSQILKLIPY